MHCPGSARGSTRRMWSRRSSSYRSSRCLRSKADRGWRSRRVETRPLVEVSRPLRLPSVSEPVMCEFAADVFAAVDLELVGRRGGAYAEVPERNVGAAAAVGGQEDAAVGGRSRLSNGGDGEISAATPFGMGSADRSLSLMLLPPVILTLFLMRTCPVPEGLSSMLAVPAVCTTRFSFTSDDTTTSLEESVEEHLLSVDVQRVRAEVKVFEGEARRAEGVGVIRQWDDAAAHADVAREGRGAGAEHIERARRSRAAVYREAACWVPLPIVDEASA